MSSRVGGRSSSVFPFHTYGAFASVGAEATAGIPGDKPVLKAATNFTYSVAKGLDLSNTLDLDISPELKFRLFGEVSAIRANGYGLVLPEDAS